MHIPSHLSKENKSENPCNIATVSYTHLSRYLGELGEKLTDLKLKVTRVRLEDDPYKTRVNGTTPQRCV